MIYLLCPGNLFPGTLLFLFLLLVLLLDWIGWVVVRTLELRLSVTGSISSHDTAQLFLR